MDVGAIGGGMAAMGGAGIGGAGAAAGGSLVGQTAPGGASAPTTVQQALAGSSTSVEQLAEFLEGFSTAQILFALMMMAAMNREDEDSNSSTAMGFLAGMALANGLGQNLGSLGTGGAAEVTPADSVGGNLNVSA